MKFSLDNIPELPISEFPEALSFYRTLTWFPVELKNGIINTDFINSWEPIGKTQNPAIIGDQKDSIAILWSNPERGKTWFLVSETPDERLQRRITHEY